MRCVFLAGWTGLVLLILAGSAQAQWVSLMQGRVYVGPPPHPFPLASDNGIPGTGAYAYNDYDWPSLRQALQTYGLFGRKVRGRPPRSYPGPGDASWAPAFPPDGPAR